MAIYLVQHGLSLPKDKDPQKGLSQDGYAETRKIADVAAFYKIGVTRIVHSGKKRAEQTAQFFQEALNPIESLKAVDGISPMDDVEAFARTIDPNTSVMIVGHLPFMQKLVSYLTTGNEGSRVYKFQNSGIVCMECESGDWYIKWTLNPKIT